MKQCKKRYNELKPKFLNKPLDEIDFGLGWREALKWVKEKLECEVVPGDVGYFIDKELSNDHYQ